MEGALIDGGLTKETERHTICTFVFRRERCSGRQWNLPPHDRVSPETTNATVEHVHRHAFAMGTAGLLPKQLSHYRFGCHSFGNRVSVLAIAGQHVIVSFD